MDTQLIFTEKQREAFLKKGIKLLLNNYFSGLNLISSEQPLPTESIVIHFLHDSERHLDKVVQGLKIPYQIVPRRAFYHFDPKYSEKEEFRTEYKDAKFYNEEFNRVSIDDVINHKYNTLIVENNELDLIIPSQQDNIAATISSVQKSDLEGPFRWLDPVIIIKTKQEVPLIHGFNNSLLLSIAKDNEELYTILQGNERVAATKDYLKKVCTANKIIGASPICHPAFHNSQINSKFLEYINRMLDPIKVVE